MLIKLLIFWEIYYQKVYLIKINLKLKEMLFKEMLMKHIKIKWKQQWKIFITLHSETISLDNQLMESEKI